MLDYLPLRLDAPLMSFGGPMVDKYGKSQRFPTLSSIAGLLGNALGYDHRDADKLERLQARLRFGARADVPGQVVKDFQTVDLGQDFLAAGWTTRGAPEGRAGGSAKTGTHIREREFLADALYLLVLTLDPAGETPTLVDVAQALAEPARPLFIGRKPCLPSKRFLIEKDPKACVKQARSLREALGLEPSPPRGHSTAAGEVSAWWCEDGVSDGERMGEEDESRLVPVTDTRDWVNQIHVGRRFMRHGQVRLPGASHGH